MDLTILTLQLDEIKEPCTVFKGYSNLYLNVRKHAKWQYNYCVPTHKQSLEQK